MRPSLIITAVLSSLLLLLVAPPSVAGAGPTELAQARVEAAEKAYAAASARHAGGQGTVEAVCEWSVRVFLAQRDQPLRGKKLVAAAKAHLERMVDLEAVVTQAVGAGTASASDAAAVAYYRAEAELWVARKGK